VTIEVSAPGHQNYVVRVTVQAKSRQSLMIPTLAVKEEPPPPPVAEAPPALTTPPIVATPVAPAPSPAVEESKTSALTVVGLVVAGAGVVGAGIGTSFGLHAMSEDKKADHTCGPDVCQEKTDFDHSEKAVRSARIANITIGVGGGLFVAGGLMFLFAPSADSKKESAFVRVVPRVGPGYAGLGVEGRL
jgi:serine/threonine-protein kinase